MNDQGEKVTTSPAREPGREALLGRARPAIRAAVIVVAAKALLFGTVVLSLQLLPPMFDVESYQRHFHWPPDEAPHLGWMLKTWDGAHYLYLSEEGYREAGASAAFYPLWPMVIRATAPLFGGSLAAALVMANLLSTIALVLLHRFVARVVDERSADLALLLAIIHPGALFYCFAYSESLFLLVTVGVVFLLGTGRVGAAALLSVLAPMTRAVGVFIAIPLAWRTISDWRGGRRPWWHVLATAAPVLGLAATLSLMWVESGSPWIGFEAQARYSSQGSILKLLRPVELLSTLGDVRFVHNYLFSAVDRIVLLAMLAGLWATARLERRAGPLTLYGAAMVLVPAVTMSMMAYTRYSAVAFPIFVGCGAALATDSRRELRWLVVAVSLLLQVFLLLRHVNSLWAA